MNNPLCKLCFKNNAIKNSHTIPQFVATFIKETSVTGKLRSLEIPNKANQDFEKLPLFCPGCESIMSKEETYFNNKIFKPIHSGQISTIEYNFHLARFCALQSFRVMAAIEFKYNDLYSNNNSLNSKLKDAYEFLREFVYSNRKTQDKYANYLIPLDIIKQEMPSYFNAANHFNHYLIRAAYSDIVTDKTNRLSILTKLCDIIILTSISPRKQKMLDRGRIFGWGQLTDCKNIWLNSGWIEQFIFDHAFTTDELDEKLSLRQQNKIKMQFEKYKDKILNSETHRAFLADKKLKQPD